MDMGKMSGHRDQYHADMVKMAKDEMDRDLTARETTHLFLLACTFRDQETSPVLDGSSAILVDMREAGQGWRSTQIQRLDHGCITMLHTLLLPDISTDDQDPENLRLNIFQHLEEEAAGADVARDGLRRRSLRSVRGVYVKTIEKLPGNRLKETMIDAILKRWNEE